MIIQKEMKSISLSIPDHMYEDSIELQQIWRRLENEHAAEGNAFGDSCHWFIANLRPLKDSWYCLKSLLSQTQVLFNTFINLILSLAANKHKLRNQCVDKPKSSFFM